MELMSVLQVNETTSIQLNQTVQPHNDYFMTSFVLPFPVLGVHSAKVKSCHVLPETQAHQVFIQINSPKGEFCHQHYPLQI